MTSPPSVITRRQYYSQVQALFDPTGFLAPVLLKGKLLMRKTWEAPNNELWWDDCLPPDLMKEMIDFFIELHKLEDWEFPRSIWPEEEITGDPWLVVFSNGS